MEDRELIERVLAGDKDAFDGLVLAYHRRLYYYVAGKIPENGEAEDIVQKTFVTAYRHLHEFDRELPLLPWLRGIALNHCRNQWRENQRRAELQGKLFEERRAALEAGACQEENFHDERRVAALKACMELLSPQEMTALRYRFIEEQSLDAIGDWLGRSSEAARLLLFRIRKRLGSCVRKRLALAEGLG